MAASDNRRTVVERVREADVAHGALREALGQVGIALPSLRVDPASCVGNEPRPLVDLGRCNVKTARALADALRADDAKGAGE